MNRQYAVGLDVGGTDIKAGVVGDDGGVVVKAVGATGPERGAGAVLADMAGLVAELIAEAAVPKQAVVGVGIGVPGPLSPSRGVLFKAANLPGFEDVPVRDELARRTGLPAVLDNDANAAAYGEFWVGAGRGVRDMVLFTLGTGVGSGVVIDGRLLRGHFENAAELGHSIVEPGGRPCACGQRGCLEQYSSAGSIVRRVVEAVESGARTVLTEHSGGIAAITAEAVAEAVRQGDELASRIWDDACRYLAIACLNVQHSFNPAKIVLGGGMSAAGDLLCRAVRQHLDGQGWSLLDDTPEVVLAELGNDAGVIGAAGLMFEAVGGRRPG